MPVGFEIPEMDVFDRLTVHRWELLYFRDGCTYEEMMKHIGPCFKRQTDKLLKIIEERHA